MANNKSRLIERIVSNDACLDEILKADNTSQVQEIFKKNGLNLSEEKVELIRKDFNEKMQTLDDKQLNEISAGLNNDRLKFAAYKGVGNGGYFGLWSGAILGATAGIVDSSIKAKKGQIGSSWHFIKDVLKTTISASLIGGIGGSTCGGVAVTAGEAVSQIK